jgi:hypothetical protein
MQQVHFAATAPIASSAAESFCRTLGLSDRTVGHSPDIAAGIHDTIPASHCIGDANQHSEITSHRAGKFFGRLIFGRDEPHCSFTTPRPALLPAGADTNG